MQYALDPSSQLFVWTYKEGLLSRVAHDLCIRATEVQAPTLEVEGGRARVELAVPVAALRVQGQVKDGEVIPLKAKDHAEIEETLRGPKVLDASRAPLVRFRGEGTREGERIEVAGQLEVQGRGHPQTVSSRVSDMGDDVLRVEGEVQLQQTALGLKPYSALMGSLKVKDRLRVSWSLLLRPR